MISFIPSQAARQGLADGLRHFLGRRDLLLCQFCSPRLEVLEYTLGHDGRGLMNLRVELLQHLDDHLVRVCIRRGDEALHDL